MRLACTRATSFVLEELIDGGEDFVERDAVDSRSVREVVGGLLGREILVGDEDDFGCVGMGGNGGPAWVGRAKESDHGNAQGGGDMTWAGVVGDHDGGASDECFERAEGDAEVGQDGAGRGGAACDGVGEIAFGG